MCLSSNFADFAVVGRSSKIALKEFVFNVITGYIFGQCTRWTFSIIISKIFGERGLNREIVNVNGGAIALGHPIGNTGCRIVVSLIHEMEKKGFKRGLAALCGSGGSGQAILVEKRG